MSCDSVPHNKPGGGCGAKTTRTAEEARQFSLQEREKTEKKEINPQDRLEVPARVEFPLRTSCTLVGVGGASVHVASGVLAGPDHAHAHWRLLLDIAAVVVDVIEDFHGSPVVACDALLEVTPRQLPRDA